MSKVPLGQGWMRIAMLADRWCDDPENRVSPDRVQ